MGKILITGGAGFIGSHLCDRFIADGHEVICIDNFLSGSRDNPFIEHDVCQPIPNLPSNIDAILHFASPASPNPESPISYMRYPVETIMVNTLGSQRMLELAVANNCQIIFASTAEVYGNPEVHPQPETYVGHVSPNGPRSSYDEGKRAMEALAFAYYRLGGTKIKVIRLFNTYGSRMRLDDGRIVPNLLKSYLQDEPFAIYGDSSTTRSFAYIDDILDGIMRVYRSDQMIGEVVNLGNPQEFTLGETLKLFEKTIGHPLKTMLKPAPPEDPVRRSPDISKATKLLGWQPKITFAEGLKKTLEYYRHA
ncbi:MAG: UDP-glucuronic acid decarboxylase 1 [Microgenomates group bacterium GW2011_GWC2_46_7]|nr:MAG: UDP-glucuronic acid decarboxylase 1 [Microgenomates group bacterium GW2011_GWC2_46_7]